MSGPVVCEDSVVVVSGGARGVTAACLLELARRYRPRLLILGRTVLTEEPAHFADAADQAALIRAALAVAGDGGRDAPSAAELGAQAAAVMAAREVRETLSRLERLGSEVAYVAADVCDAAAVNAAIATVRRRWGAVTGVIHAAGVIHDRRILDKTPEQFSRVFRTKVAGFENLLAATGADPLRLVLCFSSIAAQFGNIGQIDYAAANEVLNKLARQLAQDRCGSCLVRAVNWGPWEGGMVTPALARHLRGAAVSLISPGQGAALLCDLIDSPGFGDVELVATDAGNLDLFGQPAGTAGWRRLVEEPVILRAAE
jgi:NAD(P)-dependent dehydrogenase (short-subunit alcohol dehydrogenase family)